jgi:hypothetical protein
VSRIFSIQDELVINIPRRSDAIKAFNEIEVDLKKMLQHLRHQTNKHEPAYFAAVHNLSDKQLTNFSGMHIPNLISSHFSLSKFLLVVALSKPFLSESTWSCNEFPSICLSVLRDSTHLIFFPLSV